MNIEKQVNIPASKEGEFFWVDTRETQNLPMPKDIKAYLKILTQKPNAFILGYFDHDQTGKIINEKITTISE